MGPGDAIVGFGDLVGQLAPTRLSAVVRPIQLSISVIDGSDFNLSNRRFILIGSRIKYESFMSTWMGGSTALQLCCVHYKKPQFIVVHPCTSTRSVTNSLLDLIRVMNDSDL